MTQTQETQRRSAERAGQWPTCCGKWEPDEACCACGMTYDPAAPVFGPPERPSE